MKLRPYQDKLVSDVVRDLERDSDERTEVVLAACPGSGKTIMSIVAIERLLGSGAVKRVLVLAHATTLLRDNYVTKLTEAGPGFEFAEYVPKTTVGHVPMNRMDARVVVAIPQSLRALEGLPQFDLVVVDEAHLFYGSEMVDYLIDECLATRVLLLTGTPSPFVAQGIPLRLASMKEVYEDGESDRDGPWISDVRAAVIQSTYDVRRRDYNDGGEIKRAVAFLAEQTTQSLDELRAWLGGGSWIDVTRKVGKTMIVCRSQEIAAQAAGYFKEASVGVALSTSDTDRKSDEVHRFVAASDVSVLIVVRRADIGFDFPGLGALVDMTGTINIDRVFQMFARTVRPGVAGKLFLKFASADMFQYTRSILKASLLLAGRAFYETWNGKNLAGVMVPGDASESRAESQHRKTGLGLQRLPTIDEGFLVFGEFIKTQTREDGSLIGGTTLGEVAIALGITDRAAEGSRKTELLAFYAANDRPVRLKENAALYAMQCYLRADPDVASEQARIGYPKNTSLDLSGRRFGRLLVLRELPERHGGNRRWQCQCDCGNEVERSGSVLRRGKATGCGCHAIGLTRDQLSEVRKLLADGVPQVEIAQRYGLSQSHVSNIKLGRYKYMAVAA